MNAYERLHMRIRFLRYRLRTEWESIRFLLRQPLSGRTALDVGANKGIYSYYLSRQVGSGGRVFAFEPQPELTPHLQELRKAFRLDNLEIVGRALSDSQDERMISRSYAGHGGATLEAYEDHDRHQLAVQTTTLDAFCNVRGIDDVAFIKCDVEGHELSVFRGAEQTLRAFKPALLFECTDIDAEKGELFSFLESLGYEAEFFSGKTRVGWQKFAEHQCRKSGIQHRNYVALARAA